MKVIQSEKSFYTIISTAKSTLYSLYYKHSGRISESHVCQVFSSHLAKVRVILPDSLREDFKYIQDIEFNPTIHKSINFFLTQEKHNIARIKRESHNILCLEKYLKKETATLSYSVITGFFLEVLEERENSP